MQASGLRRWLTSLPSLAQALQLSVACLSFDFVGTSLDESAEDLATLQIPSPWRHLVEDLATMQLYYAYYQATQPPLSNAALECLVRMASVRRCAPRAALAARAICGALDAERDSS